MIAAAAVFLFPAAVSAATIFSDNFNNDYGELSTHTPTTVGTGWTLLINNGVLLYVQSYNNHVTVQSNTSDAGSFYTAEGTYSSADYEITSNVAFAGGDSTYTRSMALRVQDANNMYLLRYGTTMTIYKRVSGTWTAVTSTSVTINGNLNSPYIGDSVSFGVLGNTLTAKVNGVTKLTATDSSITAAGKAGIGIGRVAVSTDDGGTGVGIDNVVVETLSVDSTPPTITSVSSSKANGSYTIGEQIPILVTFSEAVTSSGTVTVTLETGAVDRTCTFSVTASTTGTCTYTVQAGDASSDLDATVSGTITDAAGNAMVSFTPSSTLAANKAIVIDTAAPSISSVASTASTSSASISWTTDEAASSLVSYGPTASYGTSTAEADTSPRVTSHAVSLSSLVSCATYHYHAQSADTAGNTATSSDGVFTTTGCTGSSTVMSEASSTVSTSTGATVSLKSSGLGIDVVVPANFASSSATFQFKQLDGATVRAAIGVPSGYSAAGEYLYTLQALSDAHTLVSSFSQALTVTITYAAADVSGIDETTLRIFRWDGSSWNVLSNCAVDTGAKTVTCETTSFSTFSLFGQSAGTPEATQTVTVAGFGYTPASTAPSSPAAATPPAALAISPLSPSTRVMDGVEVTTISSPVVVGEASLSGFVPSEIPCVLDLERGAQGGGVRVLQRFLNTHGFPLASGGDGAPGNETEHFGPSTLRALAAFQSAYGIMPSSGYCGPKTRAMMRRILGAGAIDETSAPARGTEGLTRDLYEGLFGDEVRWLQGVLIDLARGPVAGVLQSEGPTGFFGPLTKAALIEYQKSEGIVPAEGYLGPVTRSRLVGR